MLSFKDQGLASMLTRLPSLENSTQMEWDVSQTRDSEQEHLQTLLLAPEVVLLMQEMAEYQHL